MFGYGCASMHARSHCFVVRLTLTFFITLRRVEEEVNTFSCQVGFKTIFQMVLPFVDFSTVLAGSPFAIMTSTCSLFKRHRRFATLTEPERNLQSNFTLLAFCVSFKQNGPI